MYSLVGAGGRSAMLNPFTNKNQSKRKKKKNLVMNSQGIRENAPLITVVYFKMWLKSCSIS